jgi:hypothetical protein
VTFLRHAVHSGDWSEKSVIKVADIYAKRIGDASNLLALTRLIPCSYFTICWNAMPMASASRV